VGGDFGVMPYGLFSITAQAKEAGYDAKLYNLSSFSWKYIEKVVQKMPADFFGISCFTINRRGVDALSKLIKKIYPNAHVSVGGPHVTPMPELTLQYFKAVDSVVIGEGEQTVLEILAHLKSQQSIPQLKGMAWREEDEIIKNVPTDVFLQVISQHF